MTFVKDNKMWLIKDVSVILKSKGEFFWKGFIIGIGVTFLCLTQQLHLIEIIL